jgi:hypothetical protein
LHSRNREVGDSNSPLGKYSQIFDGSELRSLNGKFDGLGAKQRGDGKFLQNLTDLARSAKKTTNILLFESRILMQKYLHVAKDIGPVTFYGNEEMRELRHADDETG